MRQMIALGAIAMTMLSLSACLPVQTPALGILYTEVKYGDLATTSTSATKEGKACASTVMGLVATGDASIAAAKAAGGITEVSHVDHYAKSTLGIVAEWCTIVKGK